MEMMAFIYVLIVCFTAIQSCSTKLYTGTGKNSSAFNLIKSATSFAMFLLIGLSGGIRFHGGTVICGMLYGALLCASAYFGYMALSLGAMSLTSMIVSFSVAVPVIFGITVLGESLSSFKIAGLVCLAASSVLVNIKKTSMPVKNIKKWFLYILATFLCNGFNSVVQKLYQIKYNPGYDFEFMLCATFVCCVIFLLFGFKGLKTKLTFKEKSYGLIAGFTNGSVGYLTLKLASFENASILFPAITAGTILCSLCCGKLIFKEKLTINQLIAVFFGIAAVICLKI